MTNALQNANELFHAGQLTAAKAAYQKLVEADATNPDALQQLGILCLWANQLEEAERYLTVASTHTPWHRQFWPLTLNAKIQLAMLHYRADRLLETSRLFREAAGPFGLGFIGSLKAMSQQFAQDNGKQPYRIDAPDMTSIPFVMTDPLPVLEVSVNGSQPIHFLLDTGGAEVILDTAFAREVGAEIVSSMAGKFAAGKTGIMGLGWVKRLQMGECVMHDLPINTLDMDIMADFADVKLQGIIGTRFLMHFLSTIDYLQGELRLQHPTPTAIQQFDSLVQEKAAKTIPFWLIDAHTIVAQGTINGGQPQLFVVDTGVSSGFLAPESSMTEAGITVDWGKAADQVGGGGKVSGTETTINRLALGCGGDEVVEQNVPAMVLEKTTPSSADQYGLPVGGSIAHQFFRHYALTLDFTGMRLILAK